MLEYQFGWTRLVHLEGWAEGGFPGSWGGPCSPTGRGESLGPGGVGDDGDVEDVGSAAGEEAGMAWVWAPQRGPPVGCYGVSGG